VFGACARAGRCPAGSTDADVARQTDSAESHPPAPVRTEWRDPLSDRIASGRPISSNTRSRAPLTPAHCGSTIRTSIRYRLAASVIVQRIAARPIGRAKPALEIDPPFLVGRRGRRHTSPCAIARRRRRRASTRPLRFKTSPIVDAAGQATSGRARSSHAYDLLRAEKCGNRRRAAMMRSAQPPRRRLCGQRTTASGCDPPNQACPPRCPGAASKHKRSPG
jgi:hypothetical protein